jgi:hypothetical protein
MMRFGMGRSWAYKRLGLMVREGLLESHRLLHGRPGLYVATVGGLRWCGLERLGVARLAPGSFGHAWEVAAAAGLQSRLVGWRLLGEREIRVGESDTRELIASASVGRPRMGGRRCIVRTWRLCRLWAGRSWWSLSSR